MGEKVKDFSVSVIIPAYNASRTIVRTLESIKNQTRVDLVYEVIVIDDGSIDNTSVLVENYKKNNMGFPVRLIKKKNGGVSTARNVGLKEAKGSWIGLCDSDDEWLSNKLEIQYEIINAHPYIDFLGGNHTNGILKIFGKKIKTLHKANIRELCIKMFPQTSAAIFKRTIFENIGGYDETRRYAEDGQFFMKICSNYNYFYHPEKVVEYDCGKRGFGGSGLSGNLKEMQIGVKKNIKELYNQKKISVWFYFMMVIFYQMKYIRRLIVYGLKK